MAEKFGDLRGLLQQAPSREIFQQIIFLYPTGHLPAPSLEYALNHLENWPSSIRRTFPRSWFNEHSMELANGAVLCNHLMYGLGESKDPLWRDLDRKIIEAFAASDQAPHLRFLTLTDQYLPESSAALDCGVLQHASSIKHVECIEIHATHGIENIGEILLNDHLSRVTEFKVFAAPRHALSIAQNGRRSSWLRNLQCFELKLSHADTSGGDVLSDFLCWVLEGTDFPRLGALGLNIDAVLNHRTAQEISRSPALEKLSHLALQVLEENHTENTQSLVDASHLTRVKELILDGCFLGDKDAGNINDLTHQLSSLKLYRADFEGDRTNSSFLQIIRHRGELDHLVLSKLKRVLTEDPSYFENKGIKCLESFEFSDNNAAGETHDVLMQLRVSQCKSINIGKNREALLYRNPFGDKTEQITERHFSFASCHFAKEEWTCVLDLLRENEITSLDVSNNPLAKNSHEIFSPDVFKHLEALNFSEMSTDEENHILIQLCCFVSYKLKAVLNESLDHIKDNELRRKTLSMLDSEWPPNKAHISLKFIRLSIEVFGEALWSLLKQHTYRLRSLNLSENEIGSIELFFVELILVFCSIECLQLSHNKINLIQNKTCFKKTSLRSLNLSHNAELLDGDREGFQLEDCFPDTLEFIDLTGTGVLPEDIERLREVFPSLDVRVDYSGGDSPTASEQQISGFMRQRIFTECSDRVEVFPWSTAPTRRLLVRHPRGHSDPILADIVADYDRDSPPSKTLVVEDEAAWSSVLAFVPDEWLDAAHQLRALGLPAPTDTGSALMCDGLTTPTRCILEWRAQGRNVALVDRLDLTRARACDEDVVGIADDDLDDLKPVAASLRALLARRVS